MYLGASPSVYDLATFLAGYRLGLDSAGLEDSALEIFFEHFHLFVPHQEGFPYRGGWGYADILSISETDLFEKELGELIKVEQMANSFSLEKRGRVLDRFFDLFEKFCEQEIQLPNA